MSEIAQPLLTQETTDGWSFEPPNRKNRIVRRYTSAFSDVWPRDVHQVKVRGQAAGASGGRTTSADKGAGGGGGGQACFGEIDVTPGEPFSGTVGVGGVGISASIGNANGNNGSNSTLLNTFHPPITLLGGNAGLANGNGGAAAGPTTFESLLGITMVQGAPGGNGQTGDVGLPGGDVDIVKGGLGGNTSGGGGGGASFNGAGAAGGNINTAGTATPVANSGAGTGGGGADVSTAGQYGSATASDGFWEFEYWTEEEDV